MGAAVGRPALIVAPLSVARQTVREASKLDVDVRYVRDGDDVDRPRHLDHELRDGRPLRPGHVRRGRARRVLDPQERRRQDPQRLTEQLRDVPRRLACTATPAPNDVAELTNHAEFLGVMSRAEMLAAYFVNDERTGG
jgi:hypothetical protein